MKKTVATIMTIALLAFSFVPNSMAYYTETAPFWMRCDDGSVAQGCYFASFVNCIPGDPCINIQQ